MALNIVTAKIKAYSINLSEVRHFSKIKFTELQTDLAFAIVSLILASALIKAHPSGEFAHKLEKLRFFYYIVYFTYFVKTKISNRLKFDF